MALDKSDLLEQRMKPPARGSPSAELLQHAGGGQVADLGCGAGRVTGDLHALGVPTFGIDLSPAPAVFGEFHRVLWPGGYALLAVQAGTECALRDRPTVAPFPLAAYRFTANR